MILGVVHTLFFVTCIRFHCVFGLHHFYEIFWVLWKVVSNQKDVINWQMVVGIIHALFSVVHVRFCCVFGLHCFYSLYHQHQYVSDMIVLP